MFSNEDKGTEDYNFGSLQTQIMGHETGRQPNETICSENTFFDVNKKIFSLGFYTEIMLNF